MIIVYTVAYNFRSLLRVFSLKIMNYR